MSKPALSFWMISVPRADRFPPTTLSVKGLCQHMALICTFRPTRLLIFNPRSVGRGTPCLSPIPLCLVAFFFVSFVSAAF